MLQAPAPAFHVSLYVRDVAASIAWYQAFFDQAPAKVQPAYAKFELVQPSLVLSLVENPERPQPGFGHLGLRVENEAERQRWRQRAQAAGLNPEDELQTACCYAVQDKHWVYDPDGHAWEIYVFHADAAFNDPRYAQAEASACCAPTQQTADQPKAKRSLRSLGQPNTCC